MSDHQSTQTEPHARQRRRWWLGLVPFAISLILLAVPWWTLLAAQTRWPTVVVLVGTAVFVAVFVALPSLTILGHGGSRHKTDSGGGNRGGCECRDRGGCRRRYGCG